MKQRFMVVNIEFFDNQNPSDIEKKLRNALPPIRKMLVGIDHKNLMYGNKRKSLDSIGKETVLNYRCSKDGREWSGGAFIVGNREYKIWVGSDLCPTCGAKGEIVGGEK